MELTSKYPIKVQANHGNVYQQHQLLHTDTMCKAIYSASPDKHLTNITNKQTEICEKTNYTTDLFFRTKLTCFEFAQWKIILFYVLLFGMAVSPSLVAYEHIKLSSSALRACPCDESTNKKKWQVQFAGA